MNKNIIKDWTILIYANDNNELETVIWHSKIESDKVGSNDNINYVFIL